MMRVLQRQTKRFSRLGLALTAMMFALLLPSSAHAACSMSVTQTTALAWGTWQQPSSGSQTADITTADALSGTGNKLYGTAVHGVFTLTNNPQCTGTLTISLSDTGGAGGVTLSNFHLIYNSASIANGASGLAMPTNSGKTLLVGATATYTSAVTAGTKSPTLNIAMTDSGTATVKNTTETASIGFDVPITLTKVSDIDFGTVSASPGTYRMSTSGTESVIGTGVGQIYSGAPRAANITIVGSTTDGISIFASGYTTDSNVTPSNATCAYNGGAETSCDSAISGVAPGAGKTLLVGVDVDVTGSHTSGATAAPSFTINVNYQ